METTDQTISKFEELETRIALKLLENVETCADKTNAIAEYSNFLFAVTQRQNWTANQRQLYAAEAKTSASAA